MCWRNHCWKTIRRLWMLQHSQEEWFVQREYNCLVRWYHDVYHAADTQCENVGDLRRCYEMHDRTNSGWPSALPTAHCGRRRDGMMCPAKYIAFPIDQIWPDEAYLVIGWLPIPDWIALILFSHQRINGSQRLA